MLPINHYISYPKKEILTLPIHPINPYISHPKRNVPPWRVKPLHKPCKRVFPNPWQNNPIGLAIHPISFTNRVRTTGNLPESIAPVPLTMLLSGTSSMRPGSPLSTVDPIGQGGDNGIKRPSNTGAIAGGPVIGGLVALGVACVGIWMFFRR